MAGEESSERIRVCLRVRPMSEEAEAGQEPRVRLEYTSERSLTCNGHKYRFDHVFTERAGQYDVYEVCAGGVVDAVANGVNCALIAYGQTGAGKTHTIQGGLEPTERGIMPRVCADVFHRVATCAPHESFHIKASYIQIYNEKILDLLAAENPPAGLKIREDRAKRMWIIPDAECRPVTTATEVAGLIRAGEGKRKVASTQQNEQSSRSHSVLILHVSKRDAVEACERTSLLYVVDLAGSENTDRTGATGELLKEGNSINRSLHALRQVVKALVESRDALRQQWRSHVPFRDSVLTKLLQAALAGNTRTTVIVCMSPMEVDVRESESSLEFGQMTSNVMVRVKANVHLTAEELQQQLTAANSTLLMYREQERRLELRVRKLGLSTNPADLLPPPTSSISSTSHPPCFLCSHSGQLLTNPIVARDGLTYERSVLLRFWRLQGRLPSHSSPGSCTPPDTLETPFMIPNFNLLDQLRSYHEGKAPLRPRLARGLSIGPGYAPHRWPRHWPVRVGCVGELPTDCLCVCFGFLDSGSLNDASRTSAAWRPWADDDSLWRVLIVIDFGDSAEEELKAMENTHAMPVKSLYLKFLRELRRKECSELVVQMPRVVTSGFSLFARN